MGADLRNDITHDFLEVFGQIVFIAAMLEPITSYHHLDEKDSN